MRATIVSFVLLGTVGLVGTASLAVEIGDTVERPRVENPVHGEVPAPDLWDGDPVVVIEFLALWSERSRERIPRLNALRERFAGRGFVVLGFTGESEDSFRAGLKELRVLPKFPIFLDGDGVTMSRYLERSWQGFVPSAAIVDRSARLAWTGPSLDALESYLPQILDGRFDPDTGRSIREAKRASLERASKYYHDPRVTELSGARRLATAAWSPSWSPDGKRIVFARSGDGGIAVLDMASGRTRSLSDAGQDPVWSPDGDWIAFAIAANIWLVRPDGSSRRTLAPGNYPRWSKDGKSVFCFYRQQLWVTRADDPEARPRVILDRPGSRFCDVSPDGTRIVLANKEGLAVLDRQTGAVLGRWSLNNADADGGLASWSPEGDRVAFGAFDGIRFGVWIVDLSSGRGFEILPGTYTKPEWSPDGKYLAFDFRPSDESMREIWMVGVEEALRGRQPSSRRLELKSRRAVVEERYRELERLVAQKGSRDLTESEYQSFLTSLEQVAPTESEAGDHERALRLIQRARESGLDHPRLLVLRARLQHRSTGLPAAIEQLEAEALLPSARSAVTRELERLREEIEPDLATYASIDAALESPETILPEGAEWRYLPGRKQPSPGLEWTQLEFDDSGWATGPSGFGYGDEDDATVLPDMQNGYTTLYIRRRFSFADLPNFTDLELQVVHDDGLIAYLNGREIGRIRAGPAGSVPPHDATSSAHIPDPLEAVFPIEAQSLSPGENVLAIQGLNWTSDSTDFSLIPRVLARRSSPGAGTDAARLEGFRSLATSEASKRRLRYFEARVAQRSGDLATAVQAFQDLLSDEETSPLPYLRLAECQRAQGKLEDAEETIMRGFSGADAESAGLWELWFRISFADRERSASETFVALLDRARRRVSGSSLALYRRHLEDLLDDGVVRINCGGGEHRGRDGRLWSEDRFYRSGRRFGGEFGGHVFQDEIEGTQDDILYQTERWFSPTDPNPMEYAIPLPVGDYRVTLHFAEIYYREVGTRILSIALEDETVLEGLDTNAPGFAVAHRRQFDRVAVRDGVLDIRFLPVIENPKVSAIEVEALE